MQVSLKHTFGQTYNEIINLLLSLGHKVQHEHITTTSMQDIEYQNDKYRIDYYKKALKWISDADLVVIEASFPSTIHIGHEVSISLEKNKPTIVLYEKGKEPFFLRGIKSDKIFLTEYTDENLIQVLKETVLYASDASDARFNLMMPTSLNNFIEEIIKEEHVSKASYIRQLILKDKKQRNTS